jgi:hypothetical protein
MERASSRGQRGALRKDPATTSMLMASAPGKGLIAPVLMSYSTLVEGTHWPGLSSSPSPFWLMRSHGIEGLQIEGPPHVHKRQDDYAW